MHHVQLLQVKLLQKVQRQRFQGAFELLRRTVL